MSWAGRQHPVETAVEWLAPIPLALAAGWASSSFGLPVAAAVAVSLAVLAAGIAVVRLGGGANPVRFDNFRPTEFESVEPDELVLEEKDAILELSDRLEDVCPDSRVVRLFEREDPTPGELVDRIALFLGEGRPPVPSDRPAPVTTRPPDASAALHDALANIRASLR
jgi:hypothetical protein